jgi:hypothetical protein
MVQGTNIAREAVSCQGVSSPVMNAILYYQEITRDMKSYTQRMTGVAVKLGRVVTEQATPR